MTVSCETACTLVCGDSGICLYNGDMGLGRGEGMAKDRKALLSDLGHNTFILVILSKSFIFCSTILKNK